MSNSDVSENCVIVSKQDIINQSWNFRENKEVQSVEFDGLMDTLGDMKFYKCTSLTQVKLPYTVRSIGYSAFEGCKKLASIQFPFGLEEIGESAFRTCEKLQSVAIPLSVKTIGKTAFRTCKGLKEVRITKTVKKIGKDAFAGCPNLVIFTEKGSAAEKYGLDVGIPVQILSTEELKASIQKECMTEQDLLDGKLTIAKYKWPATIAVKNGNRVLVINGIQYEESDKLRWGDEFYGCPIPEFPYKLKRPRNSRPCWYYSRADMAENLLALKSEILQSFLLTGSNSTKEISKYDIDSAGKMFATFKALCESMKEEAFLRMIADFVPRKKDGSLTCNRKTLIASLPFFIHIDFSEEDQKSSNNSEQWTDYRNDITFDLVAKNISDDVVAVYLEEVDLYDEYEQDHIKAATQMADSEIAKQIMKA